ncbi:MAG: hypothetical protein EOR51_11075 [Mesorhizobium sp.]|uniref:WD40 repeat domain-containing protein n=1 Tax=Mesorhizobium sp. TaxID=1871066 RepID=UPI000FE5FEFC|nr:hypothetical protein [Mesorhizobium sp.]RWH90715.1 MAG: hypothetical protein EOQ88_33390 [Mesorhizobium sp.]RWK51610.1 MAG: hypothetical protein EOR48_25215 [Mesorhizobium sp.]RWK82677.1 MAG: hypothetical protein EOR51_11075 [Mesorhizobium sp.]RWK98866.1 MAG: hypothetical protein EOR55_34210 [Mesorhizobium sp.]
MNQQAMRNLTLFDLLARSWRRPSAITDAHFSADGTTIAFPSADGTVAIAAVADSEPPNMRIRVSGDLGQTTIRPREKPPVPLITTPQLAAGPIPITAFGQSDFLLGGGAGDVLLLRADGSLGEPVLKLESAIVAIDHSVANGVTVATDGNKILLVRQGSQFALAHGAASPVSTVALSPGGDHLAFSAGDRLWVWVSGDETMPLDDFACAGQPVSIRWNGQSLLACALGADGFSLIDCASRRTDAVAGFPAPVRSVSWSGPANALVASGAFRIAAWVMDTPLLAGKLSSGALETGRAGLFPVEAVAAHPSKGLVAAGYANGQIVVAQIGTRDELIIRQRGGPVTTLAWSPDGSHLATGDADGVAAIVTFAAQMFK